MEPAEAALVLTLALVAGAWAVLLTPIAVAVNYAQRRIEPMKTLYNVANNTVAAAAAAGVLAIVKVSQPYGVSDILTLAAAGAVAGLVTHLAVAAVVAAAQDLPSLATWRASAGLQLLTLAGNLAFAVSVLILARYAIWMVAVPCATRSSFACTKPTKVAFGESRSGRRGSGMLLRLGG